MYSAMSRPPAVAFRCDQSSRTSSARPAISAARSIAAPSRSPTIRVRAHALASLHQVEQHRGVRRDAGARSRARRGRPSRDTTVGAVDGVALVEEDRVRHRRPVVLPRDTRCAPGARGDRRRTAARRRGRSRPASGSARAPSTTTVRLWVDLLTAMKIVGLGWGGQCRRPARRAAQTSAKPTKKRRMTTPGPRGQRRIQGQFAKPCAGL